MQFEWKRVDTVYFANNNLPFHFPYRITSHTHWYVLELLSKKTWVSLVMTVI